MQDQLEKNMKHDMDTGSEGLGKITGQPLLHCNLKYA